MAAATACPITQLLTCVPLCLWILSQRGRLPPFSTALTHPPCVACSLAVAARAAGGGHAQPRAAARAEPARQQRGDSQQQAHRDLAAVHLRHRQHDRAADPHKHGASAADAAEPQQPGPSKAVASGQLRGGTAPQSAAGSSSSSTRQQGSSSSAAGVCGCSALRPFPDSIRCCSLPRAAVACAAQGVENKRCYELNEEEINKIRDEVGKHTTEADLVRGEGHAAGQPGPLATVAHARLPPPWPRSMAGLCLMRYSRRAAPPRPCDADQSCVLAPHPLSPFPSLRSAASSRKTSSASRTSAATAAAGTLW